MRSCASATNLFGISRNAAHDGLFVRFKSLPAFCSALCLKVGGFAEGFLQISRFLLEAGQEELVKR
jgi:hypothetical protein